MAWVNGGAPHGGACNVFASASPPLYFCGGCYAARPPRVGPEEAESVGLSRRTVRPNIYATRSCARPKGRACTSAYNHWHPSDAEHSAHPGQAWPVFGHLKVPLTVTPGRAAPVSPHFYYMASSGCLILVRSSFGAAVASGSLPPCVAPTLNCGGIFSHTRTAGSSILPPKSAGRPKGRFGGVAVLKSIATPLRGVPSHPGQAWPVYSVPIDHRYATDPPKISPQHPRGTASRPAPSAQAGL